MIGFSGRQGVPNLGKERAGTYADVACFSGTFLWHCPDWNAIGALGAPLQNSEFQVVLPGTPAYLGGFTRYADEFQVVLPGTLVYLGVLHQVHHESLFVGMSYRVVLPCTPGALGWFYPVRWCASVVLPGALGI